MGGDSHTILVVDDDPHVRAFLCRLLARNGYSILEARSGREALACVERLGRAIDALVTDVEMPGLDGRALVSRVSRILPGLPVIYVTGNWPIYEELLDEGCRAVAKPFVGDRLLAEVREVLDIA